MYPRLLRASILSAALAGGSFLGWPSAGSADGAPTYSGQATVARATVSQAPLAPISVTLSDTGLQQGQNFAEERSLLTVSQPLGSGGQLNGEVAPATTVATDASRSAASVAQLDLALLGQHVAADFLMARATAQCGAGGATTSGTSDLATLVIDGSPIAVSGSPNQSVTLPANAGTVIINEQSSSAGNGAGSRDVNALHVVLTDPTSGATLADVVIAHAHADANCPAAPPPPPSCGSTPTDFVTGGGWITSPSDSKSKANFAVAGGIKNGAFWGHLLYIDHGNPGGYQVKGTGVTGYNFYPAWGTTARQILGTADVNGSGPNDYEADVADNGEPGSGTSTTPPDEFQLAINHAMIASGPLKGGNIQLHKACI